MKNLFNKVLLSIIVLLFLFFPFVNISLATGTTSTTPSTTTTGDYGLSSVKGKGLVERQPSEIVGTIIQYVLGLVGVILVVVMIYGGVLYMTSGGNEEKVTTAKKALTYGIIGIAIIALSFAITRYILDAFFK